MNVKKDFSLILNNDIYTIEPEFNITNGNNIQYKILKISLNPQAKKILIIIVGLSLNSFTINFNTLKKNLNKIKDKYKEIFFFQTDAKENLKKYIKFIQEKENKEELLINDMMQQIMAKHIDKIIRQLNKKIKADIDVMGVSFGGGIASILSTILKIKKLILVAPGITQGISIIPKKQEIILSWCIQDNKLPFNTYGIKSINQLSHHNNKTILLSDLILEKDKLTDDITHKLQDCIFDII